MKALDDAYLKDFDDMEMYMKIRSKLRKDAPQSAMQRTWMKRQR